MLKVAALAYLPIAAVLFGLLVLAITAIPQIAHDFEAATALYYGAADAHPPREAPARRPRRQGPLSGRHRRRNRQVQSQAAAIGNHPDARGWTIHRGQAIVTAKAHMPKAQGRP